MDDLNTTNKFAVTASLQGITILKPPHGPITHDDALNLAAWLVALADHEKKFQTIVLAEIATQTTNMTGQRRRKRAFARTRSELRHRDASRALAPDRFKRFWKD